jgi:hypothetical protein
MKHEINCLFGNLSICSKSLLSQLHEHLTALFHAIIYCDKPYIKAFSINSSGKDIIV